jgi:UDP-glucose 4-epimerase
VKVLLTGGAGYIGSVTARALELAGHVPVILDSLVTGPRAFVAGRTFYEGDIADGGLVARILDEHPDMEHVLHLAARIVVPESVAEPHLYYDNNVVRSLELFRVLQRLGVSRVIFSSSASVYAPTSAGEVQETSPVGPTSPYARTKLMTEMILEDLGSAGLMRSVSLRYFNPIGSDPELRSGTHVPRPTHVLGQLTATALGQQETFTLTGTDFNTRDGSGLRDYIHVWDLARAHVRAVERFDDVLSLSAAASAVCNIGTGRGVTVRELISIVEAVTGRPLPVTEAPARAGDSPGAYANVEKAARLLNWRAELSVEDGVRSALAWARRRDRVLGSSSVP